MIDVSRFSRVQPFAVQAGANRPAMSAPKFQGLDANDTQTLSDEAILSQSSGIVVEGKNLSNRELLTLILQQTPKKRFFHKFGVLLSRKSHRFNLEELYSKIYPNDKGPQLLTFDKYLSDFHKINLPREQKFTYSAYCDTMQRAYNIERYERQKPVEDALKSLVKGGLLDDIYTKKQMLWTPTAKAKALLSESKD